MALVWRYSLFGLRQRDRQPCQMNSSKKDRKTFMFLCSLPLVPLIHSPIAFPFLTDINIRGQIKRVERLFRDSSLGKSGKCGDVECGHHDVTGHKLHLLRELSCSFTPVALGFPPFQPPALCPLLESPWGG